MGADPRRVLVEGHEVEEQHARLVDLVLVEVREGLVGRPVEVLARGHALGRDGDAVGLDLSPEGLGLRTEDRLAQHSRRQGAGEVVTTEGEGGDATLLVGELARRAGHLERLVGVLAEQVVVALGGGLRVDVTGRPEVVDGTLGRTRAAVVTVEAPRVVGVAVEVALQRPSVDVVEVQPLLVDERLGVLDGHGRRTEASLEEAHAGRRRRIEQRGEDGSLVEAGDVDIGDFGRVGHGSAFSCNSAMGGY